MGDAATIICAGRLSRYHMAKIEVRKAVSASRSLRRRSSFHHSGMVCKHRISRRLERSGGPD